MDQTSESRGHCEGGYNKPVKFSSIDEMNLSPRYLLFNATNGITKMPRNWTPLTVETIVSTLLTGAI
jgi:hypothetical protein